MQRDTTWDALDEAFQVTQTLESIQSSLKKGLDQKCGLGVQEAQALKVGLEHLSERVGLPGTISMAMEDFQTRPVYATRVALEGIGETLRKIWLAIVEVLTKIADSIGDFFSRFDTELFLLEESSYKLMEQARGQSGRQASNKTLIPPEILHQALWARVLKVAGKLTFSHVFLQEYTKNSTILKALHGHENDLAKNGQILLEKAMEQLTDSAKFEDVVQQTLKFFSVSAVGKEEKDNDYSGEGVKVIVQPLIFGDMAYYSVLGTEGEKSLLEDKYKRFVAAQNTDYQTQEFRMGTMPLSPKEIMDLCKSVRTRIEELKNFALVQKAVQQAAQKAKYHLNKSDPMHTTGDQVSNAKKLLSLISAYLKMLSKGTQSLRTYEISVMKASFGYAKDSLRALNAPMG